MPNKKPKQESLKLFEEMFEKQVHTFLEQHSDLIDEELNVFEMAKKFEERYDFVIFRGKDEVNRKIEVTRERNKILFNNLMASRKEQIHDEMSKLSNDIEKSIDEHNAITEKQIKNLEKLYQKNKSGLIEKIIGLLGMKF